MLKRKSEGEREERGRQKKKHRQKKKAKIEGDFVGRYCGMKSDWKISVKLCSLVANGLNRIQHLKRKSYIICIAIMIINDTTLKMYPEVFKL